MKKRPAEDVKREYVDRDRAGWYSITVTDWFPSSEFERLLPEEQVKQRGYCLSSVCLGGLTYRTAYQVLAYLELFVGEFFGGRFKEEFLSKIKKAEKGLYQIRDETKDMEYPNEFSFRDDGCPEWRRGEF